MKGSDCVVYSKSKLNAWKKEEETRTRTTMYYFIVFMQTKECMETFFTVVTRNVEILPTTQIGRYP